MLRTRRAGERRHQVTLQRVTGRVAAGEGHQDTWSTYGTVWASVAPVEVSAAERQTANTLQVPVTHLVEIDYRSDVRAAHRVVLNGRYLYIRGLQNVDERNVTWQLSCEERVQ